MADIDLAAMELPAPYINQFQFVSTGNNVRISFAEGYSGTPAVYRSAVTMSWADALELTQIILDNLPQNLLTSLAGVDGFPAAASIQNARQNIAAVLAKATARNRR